MVSGTSVLTAFIQTYFWSIINNSRRVNRWIELLVTFSNKLKDIKSISCFSGTPHFPIHSILPKIIISLVNQGLFKLCVSYGIAVTVSFIKSSKSRIRKWDWKDERHLLTFLCVAGTHKSHRLYSEALFLACIPLYKRLALLLCQLKKRHGQMEQHLRALLPSSCRAA